MQCHEVRDLLDSFLGQELLVETNHELMHHLEGCPDCRAELEARRGLRAALQRAFTTTERLQPRPDFAADVLGRVRTSRSSRVGWSALRTWGALAASVLLITAVGLLIVRSRVTAVARDAAGDHRNCAVQFRLTERPISLAEAAARYDPVYARLEDTPPRELMTSAGLLRVVDRHSCVFGGRRFGHVVLQFEGQLVSLLITAQDPSTPRADASASDLSWLPSIEGQRVASFTTPGHAGFVVSDVPDQQFRAIARALAPQVSSRLGATLWSIRSGYGD
jgi:hypothetical protein